RDRTRPARPQCLDAFGACRGHRLDARATPPRLASGWAPVSSAPWMAAIVWQRSRSSASSPSAPIAALDVILGPHTGRASTHHPPRCDEATRARRAYATPVSRLRHRPVGFGRYGDQFGRPFAPTPELVQATCVQPVTWSFACSSPECMVEPQSYP